MTKERILDLVRGFDGILELAPAEGDDHPEITWGDHFFYYAPDGQVPRREQPYATIVTKDYPGDAGSALDAPGRWRLNVHVGRDAFTRLIGGPPHDATASTDLGETDVLFPHPVYGRQGWVAVVNPGERTTATVIELLTRAHDDARRRSARRKATRPSAPER